MNLDSLTKPPPRSIQFVHHSINQSIVQLMYRSIEQWRFNSFLGARRSTGKFISTAKNWRSEKPPFFPNIHPDYLLTSSVRISFVLITRLTTRFDSLVTHEIKQFKEESKQPTRIKTLNKVFEASLQNEFFLLFSIFLLHWNINYYGSVVRHGIFNFPAVLK